MKKGNLINEEIRSDRLRVIGADGEQAGIMLRDTALDLAERENMDLVLISPNADPPVARVMDYGKYRYNQQKREKEAKKKQKVIQVKEIRLGTFIEKHDIEVKATNAIKFLKEGDKLKVTLRFKGRERGRTEKGFEVMERFAELIADYGNPEKKPSFEGRSLTMIVSPVPPKKKPHGEGDKDAPAAAKKVIAPEAAASPAAGDRPEEANDGKK